jgi:serine protease Do
MQPVQFPAARSRLIPPPVAMITVGLAVLLMCTSASAEGERFWSELPDAPLPEEPRLDTLVSSLADRVSPAVINIDVQYGVGKSSGGRGQGSGFIITSTGFALTNHHVITGAKDILVTLSDDRKYPARVIGSDESTDVALIQLDGARDLPFLPLGDSEKLPVGEWVVAIGNPLGLRSTVTVGIVSAKGRRDLRPTARRFYSNFIQTDASINPGNSGGPLLNLRGEVIGINTAINRLGQGIGFAIPVNMVKTILPALRERGFVRRSWMGIRIQELDRALSKSFGLKEPSGALVTDVVSDGPGAAAGLLPGDVVLEFDGRKVRSSEELPWLASTAGVGRSVPVKVWRNRKRKTLKLALVAMPDQSAPLGLDRARPPEARMGADMGLDARDAKGRDGEGAVLVKMAGSSPAQGSGLEEGDVVVQVGSTDVRSAGDFYKALEKSNGVVRLRIRRQDATFFFAFEPR